MSTKPAKVFFSYAHEDEEFKGKLIKHLAILKRQSIIETWHDRMIAAGDEWKDEIDENLEKADIILLLISADFLVSDYCWDVEMTRALERHNAREARVIPIILRSVDWSGAPFAQLQALPKDAKPVTEWTDEDAAFTEAAKGIRNAIESP